MNEKYSYTQEDFTRDTMEKYYATKLDLSELDKKLTIELKDEVKELNSLITSKTNWYTKLPMITIMVTLLLAVIRTYLPK